MIYLSILLLGTIWAVSKWYSYVHSCTYLLVSTHTYTHTHTHTHTHVCPSIYLGKELLSQKTQNYTNFKITDMKAYLGMKKNY